MFDYLASMKISGTHWKCIENFRAIVLIRTANCILTYSCASEVTTIWRYTNVYIIIWEWVLGRGLAPSPVKKTLNKWARVSISGTNWKSMKIPVQCISSVYR